MGSVILAIAVVATLLGRLQKTWKEFKADVIKKVYEAERKWTEHGDGEKRKAWVLEQALAWLESLKLNWIEEFFARLAVEHVVDQVVDYLNRTLGKDWGKEAGVILDKAGEAIGA